MHSGRKERRLKTIERIGGRTGFVVAAPGRALPLTARVRGHSRTRPSRTVRRQWRLRRLTHTLMQTRETYSPHTHTHTQTHTLTWHKRKRAQRNARSPTTVISYLKAFATRDGHLLFSDHSPVRLVWSSRFHPVPL